MPGVFYTPGWAAILPVGGTLGGVLVTQLVNVWNKRIDAGNRREDRQHERALDYEQRAWQAKSDALKHLISAGRFITWQAKSPGAENTNEKFRRARTIRALDLFRDKIGGEDGISEVTAYAAEPVCKALGDVLDVVDVQRIRHLKRLKSLRDIGKRMDTLRDEFLAVGPEVPDADDKLEMRLIMLNLRQRELEALGNDSDLDVDSVLALCDRLINVAQTDLKGRFTE